MPIRIAVVNTGKRGTPADVFVVSPEEVGPDLVLFVLVHTDTLFKVLVLAGEDEMLVVFMEEDRAVALEDRVVVLMVLLSDVGSVS